MAADQTKNPSDVCLYPLYAAGTDGHKKQTWRIRRADDYRELTPAVQFADIVIDIGRSRYASISTNAHWADYDDFEYEITSGGNYVTYNATTNSFTGQNIGTASVTAMHKTTGLTRSFNITVTKKAIIIIPGSSGHKVWLKPFRKKAVLQALETDICAEAAAMVEENPYILHSYEANEDFTVLTVYYYDGVSKGVLFDRTETAEASIKDLMIIHYLFDSEERFSGSDGMFVYEAVPYGEQP